MRVLLVSHYYAEHRGGVEIVAGELAKRFAARGVDLLWAASQPAPKVETAPITGSQVQATVQPGCQIGRTNFTPTRQNTPNTKPFSAARCPTRGDRTPSANTPRSNPAEKLAMASASLTTLRVNLWATIPTPI